MKLLDTFAGIGGFSLGLESSGMETIAFCEIEDYPRKVLAKNWPGIPIAKDVTKLNYKDEVLYDDGQEIYRGPIDVISGGFPCQDISVAGNQAGIEEGTRSGLWSECARLLREIQPKYAIYENVTALLSGDSGGWFQRVLSDISEVGYDAEWHCIQPDFVGIPTIRDRVWILSYPKEKHVAQVVDSRRLSLEHRRMGADHLSRFGWAVDGSQMGRDSNGVPDVTHRFGCLGNAVVPQIPELIGRAIMESHND
ncbi:MAG: DNA (cytosine-5-)-methyltransferase [Betaproteobacteria bacterium]|nr:MAG: DNA (cytosine-5-)-methyltransferase [Bacteroidota bacterium]TDI80609.1 MAG: DNA (cytosine-5-)-methyltransferase [Betaproteobacteria bacterium]